MFSQLYALSRCVLWPFLAALAVLPHGARLLHCIVPRRIAAAVPTVVGLGYGRRHRHFFVHLFCGAWLFSANPPMPLLVGNSWRNTRFINPAKGRGCSVVEKVWRSLSMHNMAASLSRRWIFPSSGVAVKNQSKHLALSLVLVYQTKRTVSI